MGAKALRHHTDDLLTVSAHPHDSPQHVRAGSEALVPERMAENHRPGRPLEVRIPDLLVGQLVLVLGSKRPSELRCHPEELEEAVVDGERADGLGTLVSRTMLVAPKPKIWEAISNAPELRTSAACGPERSAVWSVGCLAPDEGEPITVRVRQRLEEHAVDD